MEKETNLSKKWWVKKEGGREGEGEVKHLN